MGLEAWPLGIVGDAADVSITNLMIAYICCCWEKQILNSESPLTCTPEHREMMQLDEQIKGIKRCDTIRNERYY